MSARAAEYVTAKPAFAWRPLTGTQPIILRYPEGSLCSSAKEERSFGPFGMTVKRPFDVHPPWVRRRRVTTRDDDACSCEFGDSLYVHFFTYAAISNFRSSPAAFIYLTVPKIGRAGPHGRS